MSQTEKIVVIEAYTECFACPTIIIGKTSDGWAVYARYRWGQLSVRVDPSEPAPLDGAMGCWIVEKQLDPEGLDGWLDYETLREITAEIMVWPDELSPRTYDNSEATDLEL